jgi:hypothetical protein
VKLKRGEGSLVIKVKIENRRNTGEEIQEKKFRPLKVLKKAWGNWGFLLHPPLLN